MALIRRFQLQRIVPFTMQYINRLEASGRFPQSVRQNGTRWWDEAAVRRWRAANRTREAGEGVRVVEGCRNYNPEAVAEIVPHVSKMKLRQRKQA